jgi:hypothetical protein
LSSTQKIVFLIIGIVPLALGIVLVGTAGIKGFNGTGGEDTMLFQLLTYVMVPAILGGLLAVASAFRPSRLFALVSGVLLILPGLFLTLLNPVYGGPIIILGIAALVMRGKIPKN